MLAALYRNLRTSALLQVKIGRRWCRDPLRGEGEDHAGGVVPELADLSPVVWSCSWLRLLRNAAWLENSQKCTYQLK